MAKTVSVYAVYEINSSGIFFRTIKSQKGLANLTKGCFQSLTSEEDGIAGRMGRPKNATAELTIVTIRQRS